MRNVTKPSTQIGCFVCVCVCVCACMCLFASVEFKAVSTCMHCICLCKSLCDCQCVFVSVYLYLCVGMNCIKKEGGKAAELWPRVFNIEMESSSRRAEVIMDHSLAKLQLWVT